MKKIVVKVGDIVHVRGMDVEFEVVKVTDVRGDNGERYILLRDSSGTLFTSSVSELSVCNNAVQP